LNDNLFSDFDPQERIHIALLRLDRAKGLLQEVISLAEQRRAIIPVLHPRWMASPSLPLTTFLVTIIHFEISHICRLWDKPELSGYGLPTIAALIEEPAVLSLVETSLKEREPGEDANAAKMEHLKSALKLIKDTEASDALSRVRNHRHKHIAHPVLRTREERKRSFDMPRVPDFDSLLFTWGKKSGNVAAT
jgi:hypothetical protein